ncbi:hypothetical protein K1T71_002207 [Dendrolimus kikuchii]|uniref:Uncharacterized protein n=1 Tax=Dendrolimus kikuchii TaxID=765133 RepID=A0ACC1DFV0_9NEOP|nr:hypothetical protein K1T71_002207 [Dendrolimus kikuchii]
MIEYLVKYFLFIFLILSDKCKANDILGCGGFVKSHVNLDFSKIEIGLYNKAGSLKEKTECAPTNGYYFLPLYEKGEYVLKVHPPAGWSFEPSQVDLTIDGVTDQCSTGQDVNFAFNGFGITGRVITAGRQEGPSGIAVQLVNDKGEVRNTVTTVGGDFHFTPVIPGKYTVKASHQRWKLDPAQAVVQVKEGNTVLPSGVLAVKGYDVSGSVTSFGSPISGVYVLLYSKEENPKFRVEGCNTALLQGVPDSPICHSVTDASGEFKFGLVPSGQYSLLALSTPPGQVAVSYNVKPERVPFVVKHDSLFIRNAFEVTGFTLVGSVVAAVSGPGLSGTRVLLDGRAVGNSDGTGKFTLPSLQPGVYTLGFQHEQCEFEDVQVSVLPSGPKSVPRGRAARWRVCGAVAPPHHGGVALLAEGGQPRVIRVPLGNDGKWCTFLPPGVYSARVEVSDQEQRDGLQYYPLSQKVAVGNAPVEGVLFSQLKGKLSGKVECKDRVACAALEVTLRPLSADGGYVGQPLTTIAKDGKYIFEEVLPGSVEISVPTERLCWVEARHNVAVTQEHADVPTFHHTGYVLKVHSTHEVQVEFSSGDSAGELLVPAGLSQSCVDRAALYTLTPRGCHRFNPPQLHADTSAEVPTTVYLVATAHAVVIKVTSPDPVEDLVLRINTDGHGTKEIGPLTPLKPPTGGYNFEHTLYMADGEVAVVSAHSSSLLFQPPDPQQVMGGGECQPEGLIIRALRGLTLSGRIVPPVDEVLVTLQSDDLKLTQVTTSEGTYKFGPLDASKKYTIRAEKESYILFEPDQNGDIKAHKLAEITVELLDDADNTPLQGALVSVSGGTYRRNVVSGPGGRLRFGALSPAQYYVKPNMKEYKFTPPHKIVAVQEGHTHELTLRYGALILYTFQKWPKRSLLSLGGVGWRGATLLALPAPDSPPHCAPEEATTEAKGTFSSRVLAKTSKTSPNTTGLSCLVVAQRDVEGVRLVAVQPQQTTDAAALVHAPSLDHYRSLRLTLAPEAAPHTPIYSTKLDPAGYSQTMNPGLMYTLPRLPADNKTYILQLESTLSKASHAYEEQVHYFTSDGHFKFFHIQFSPKVKSSEQELRQTSLLVIPLLIALALVYKQREQLMNSLVGFASGRTKPMKPQRVNRPEVLDKPTIDQIVSTVNAAGKKVSKKKAQ